MAITSSQSNAQSVTSVAHGYYLDSAASPVALNAAVGFKPRHVVFENLTDRIKYEWYEGMAQNSMLQTVAAGTRTLVVSAAITTSDAGAVLDASLTLQNKQYAYRMHS
jgi:hypothetical protein